MCTVILMAQRATGQESLPPDSGDTGQSFFNRKNMITFGIAAHTVFTTYIEYQWWWKGDYHPFTFQVEGFLSDYSVGVDKFGHLYTSHFYFHTLYNLMKWGGYDESTTLWVSAVIPAAYAFSIEVGDGFSSYHFSPDDLIFNFSGIGFGILQEQYPFLKNFKIKWSYFPTASNVNSFQHPFSADYDAHIYWMSFNVHNLLPESAARYWPKLLNVAVGYGGNNISTGAVGPLLRKLAIGLDYNLTSIPLDGDTWDLVKNTLDLFHLPAPGARFVESKPPEYKLFLLH